VINYENSISKAPRETYRRIRYVWKHNFVKTEKGRSPQRAFAEISGNHF
jgi:hypothetical protein